MALDYSSLGEIHQKRANVNDLRVYNGSDTNYAQLSVDTTSSNYTIKMPPVAQDNTTLLTDGTDISATLIDINGATNKASPADADEVLIYDSVGLGVKKATIANIKAQIAELPSSHSAGEILVSDGSDFNAAAVSGDVTCDSSGAFTISASAVEESMIASSAVTEDKIDDAAVSADKLGANACTDAKINSLNGTTDGAVSASSLLKVDASSDLSGFNELGAATVSASSSVGAPVLEIGTGANRWKFSLDASNNLSLSVSTDSGSTYTQKHNFST